MIRNRDLFERAIVRGDVFMVAFVESGRFDSAFVVAVEQEFVTGGFPTIWLFVFDENGLSHALTG